MDLDSETHLLKWACFCNILWTVLGVTKIQDSMISGIIVTVGAYNAHYAVR